MSDLDTLLDALSIDGPVAVCRQYPREKFTAEVVTVDKVPGIVSRHMGASQWMSLAQVDTTAGRGTAQAVRRLLALPNDFDVKPGGFPDRDTARAAIGVLADMLDAQPAAIVDTGNGLQAWWVLDADDPAWRCDDNTDPRWLDITAAVRRWGRLVRAVCERYGAGMDSVFDIARVQRIPGSLNMKNPLQPKAVTATLDTWAPVTMEGLIEALDNYGVAELPGDRDITGEVVSAAGDWTWADRTCAYGKAAVAGLATDSPRKAQDGTYARHPWLLGKATRMAALHRYGCLTADDHAAATTTLVDRFRQVIADSAYGMVRQEAPGEVKDALAFGVRKVEGWTDDRLAQEFTTKEGVAHVHDGVSDQWLATFDRPQDALTGFVTKLREYLDLPDPSHVLATLGVAATADLDGDPVWLLNVASPSTGKTEAVRLLDHVADARLDDITAAGLLSWSHHKPPRPQGVLVRLGDSGLVTFGDLSSLLATSDRGGRDQVFGMLRRVYDGHAARDVAPTGGNPDSRLSWTGRATVVAAVTGAIDNYAAHGDALGPRWLYCRLTPRDTAGRRKAARKARQGGLEERRRTAADIAASLVLTARSRIVNIEVDPAVEDAVEDAALVTCWGRATVPRSGYGRKEPEGAPEVEDPPRLIRQALMLARGLLALGLDVEATATLTRRCILDSMPATRRAILTTLAAAQGEALSTAEVARRAGLHRHVARIALEDMEAVGAAEGRRVGADEELDEEREDRRARTWTLSNGPDGDLVSDVFADHHAAVDRWHEMWELTLSTPPDNTSEDSPLGMDTHTSCHPSSGEFPPGWGDTSGQFDPWAVTA